MLNKKKPLKSTTGLVSSTKKKVPKDLVLAITYDILISGTKLGFAKKQYINSISIK